MIGKQRTEELCAYNWIDSEPNLARGITRDMKRIGVLWAFAVLLALRGVDGAGTSEEDEYGIKKFDNSRTCSRDTIVKEIGYVSQVVGGESSVGSLDLDILCNDIETEFGEDVRVGLECGIIEKSASECEFMLKTVFIDMKGAKKADSNGLDNFKNFKRLIKLYIEKHRVHS